METIGQDQILSIAWDEAQDICVMVQERSGTRFSRFASLRRALRRLNGRKVWSIFLSTTGKLQQFATAPQNDASDRIVRGELHIPTPFSALGFDHLAEQFVHDGTMTLEHVASKDFRYGLGRPL